MQIQTAGTGPYQLTQAANWEWVSLTKRVPEGHWLYDVDFEEFEFVWAPESLTRMALLLAKEVQISQIDRTLQPDAEVRGMRVILSTTGIRSDGDNMYGGLACGKDFTPAEIEECNSTEKFPDHYTPGLPLENINIRKALNKAIDREANQQRKSTWAGPTP